MSDEVKVPQKFTRFNNGDCPVSSRASVDLLFRDGTLLPSHPRLTAMDFSWTYDDKPRKYDIIAYRVVTP